MTTTLRRDLNTDSGLLRCPTCRNVLGQLTAEVFALRHQGREIVIDGGVIVALKCEKCHSRWSLADLVSTATPPTPN